MSACPNAARQSPGALVRFWGLWNSKNTTAPRLRGGGLLSEMVRSTHALKLEPQPQVEVEFGLLKTKPEPMISSL
ncbi:MAG: hypothetical protein RL354_738 [Planctomycetota bacterium]